MDDILPFNDAPIDISLMLSRLSNNFRRLKAKSVMEGTAMKRSTYRFVYHALIPLRGGLLHKLHFFIVSKTRFLLWLK